MVYQLTEYDNYHDAISLLWTLYERVDNRLRGRIVRAIGYLRERAYESLPWPADADSSYGKLV